MAFPRQTATTAAAMTCQALARTPNTCQIPSAASSAWLCFFLFTHGDRIFRDFPSTDPAAAIPRSTTSCTCSRFPRTPGQNALLGVATVCVRHGVSRSAHPLLRLLRLSFGVLEYIFLRTNTPTSPYQLCCCQFFHFGFSLLYLAERCTFCYCSLLISSCGALVGYEAMMLRDGFSRISGAAASMRSRAQRTPEVHSERGVCIIAGEACGEGPKTKRKKKEGKTKN